MNASMQRVGVASACGGQGLGNQLNAAQPRPMTRLEAAQEMSFRALCRLRELQCRAGALADRLVGAIPEAQCPKGALTAGSEIDRPLVRAIEETAEHLHDALNLLEAELGRLEL